MFENLKKAREKIGGEEIRFRDYTEPHDVQPEPTPAPQEPAPASAETDANANLELKVVTPESFGEVSEIADLLLSGCTVIANIERLERPEVIRMLDFLNGVTYTFDGEIRQISQTTFVITPHNVGIDDAN